MAIKHFIDGKRHIKIPQITSTCIIVQYLFSMKLQVKKKYEYHATIMHLDQSLERCYLIPVGHACGAIGICQGGLVDQVVDRCLETGRYIGSGDAATLLFYRKKK